MYEQMTGYKRLRRQHQKAIIQLETKCRQELEDHKQKLDKEYENLLTQFSKDLEKLQNKHQKELQKKVCNVFYHYFIIFRIFNLSIVLFSVETQCRL